ncbi:MAG TPA: pyruvate-binding protein, partial [Methylotenera sp.]|nr:pyruvate-binding protein [Methylotenera sp.]
MTNKLMGLALLFASLIPVQSMAAVYQVKAYDNSTSGGTGVAVAAFNVGDAFTVSVNPLDLWNAGALPRWSNANGLTGNLFATGGDDANGDLPSGTAGVQIGQSFGT